MKEMEKRTIAAEFIRSTDQWKDKVAYAYKHHGEWVDVSYGEVRKRAENIARALWSMGLRRGDHIAILSENRPEWSITDYAVTSPGMVTVTVYPTLLPSHIQYILKNSDTKAIFVSNRNQAEKIIGIKKDLPELQFMVVFDWDRSLDEPWIYDYAKMEAPEHGVNTDSPFHFAEESLKTRSDEIMTIIYTSGTTGNPKGVMLSHGNLWWNAISSIETLKPDPDEVFLSFLPLSHSLERTTGNIIPMMIGGKVYFATNISTVAQEIREVKPTIAISVPRLFEKMYVAIQNETRKFSGVKKQIFKQAIKTGKMVSRKYKQYGKEPRGIHRVQYAMADMLVFKKLRSYTGGRIKFFISGGAPLLEEIGEFFDAVGILILQGYGLTEASPVTHTNRRDRYKFSTVGKPIHNVEHTLTEEGEILVKGPNVMQGYYKDPRATAEMIDEEGWLHTGDIGEIDLDGYLKITDRIKNIIVTSGGKNIAPSTLETELMKSAYIEQIVIIGDKRNYLTALIVPKYDQMEALAQEYNIHYDSYRELINHYKIVNTVHEDVQRIQQKFARYEQIKKIALLPEPFSIEKGEVTPSRKIKRNVVENHYREIIDTLYH
ncbi:MAG: long-chain fatty acid--CoA ligase [Candidatus Neomarinimicrobiota bacterium]|nr:MAG: long-chain fatty acid--CoA ligase [Candidatus Neomarinimicrobiota bacterium]